MIFQKYYSFSCYKCLNLLRGDKSDVNRQNMVHARSKYKSCMRNARLLYDKSESDKLNKLKYKNTHDYWKLLKRVSQSAKPNIQLSMFERYFKANNSPDSHFWKDFSHFSQKIVLMVSLHTKSLPLFNSDNLNANNLYPAAGYYQK